MTYPAEPSSVYTDATINDLLSRVADLEAWKADHVGDSAGLTGQFYQHPVSSFDTAEFGGGVMRLDATGMQFVSPLGITPIWFLQNFTSTPSTTNPSAYIIGEANASAGSMTLRVKAPDSTTTDIFLSAVNTSLASGQINVKGTTVAQWEYNGTYWFAFFACSTALAVSSSAAAVASSGTITTSNVSVARVSPAGAVTGVILQAGVNGGQLCAVVNEAIAANSVTFAASGTSNVADGTSSVIAGLNARLFVWDSGTSLWYPCK